MSNLVQIVEELQSKREQLHHELTRVDAAIEALRGVTGGKSTLKAVTNLNAAAPRRVLSLSARRRIAAAQRARWAKVRGQQKGVAVTTAIPKRVMSIGARRRIAAAQRARWAKVRAQKKAA